MISENRGVLGGVEWVGLDQDGKAVGPGQKTCTASTSLGCGATRPWAQVCPHLLRGHGTRKRSECVRRVTALPHGLRLEYRCQTATGEGQDGSRLCPSCGPRPAWAGSPPVVQVLKLRQALPRSLLAGPYFAAAAATTSDTAPRAKMSSTAPRGPCARSCAA